jgi:hypothetical protein
MIKNNNVERALHSWLPWCKAIDEGRQQAQLTLANSKRLWSYAGRVLKSLGLPPEPLLRLYFLACVFSEYKRGDTYVFSEIKVPRFLCQGLSRLRVFPAELGYLLKEAAPRPFPPAIWSRQDIEFYRYLVPFFGEHIIVLSKRHPLRQIGAKTKRSIDTDKAIFCARMKDTSASYKEISDKFGWKPQKDSYGRKTRYPTAYRYVALGRKLLSASEVKSKSTSAD